MNQWSNQFRSMTYILYISASLPFLLLVFVLMWSYSLGFSSRAMQFLALAIIIVPLDLAFTFLFLKRRMVPKGPLMARTVNFLGVAEMDAIVEEVLMAKGLKYEKLADAPRETPFPKTNAFEYRLEGTDVVVEFYRIERYDVVMLGIRYDQESELVKKLMDVIDVKIGERLVH
jgi:hypothetical protein